MPVRRGLQKLHRIAYRLAKTPRELRRIRADPDALTRAAGLAIEETLSGRLTAAEEEWVQKIESLRNRLLESRERVDPSKDETVGGLCRSASKTPLWTLLLFRLIRRLEPSCCLELGTCLGVSASYQAAALALNGSGRLVTIEGSAPRARRAEANLRALGLANVEILGGRFADVLPDVFARGSAIDFAFIDGHHEERATLEYLEQLTPFLSPGAVLVFDDISWSPGMSRAWRSIQSTETLRASIDLFLLGICIWSGEGGATHHYKVALE